MRGMNREMPEGSEGNQHGAVFCRHDITRASRKGDVFQTKIVPARMLDNEEQNLFNQDEHVRLLKKRIVHDHEARSLPCG